MEKGARRFLAYGDSWEEQAFAQDASGSHGGSIWPPRSYTCSFCKREFRSAQALGGHMNVHRRDRARLRQGGGGGGGDIHQEDFSHHQNSFSSHVDFQNSRVSFKETFEQEQHEISFPSIIQETNKKPLISFPILWSTSLRGTYFSERSGCRSTERDKHTVFLQESRLERSKPDLSMNLSLIFSRSFQKQSGGVEQHALGFKRRRIDENYTYTEADKVNLSSNSLEELDLELRLGNQPKARVLEKNSLNEDPEDDCVLETKVIRRGF